MGEDDPGPKKKAKRRDEADVERRLAELQAELESESRKAAQAVAESRRGVETSARRRPAKPAPAPDQEDPLTAGEGPGAEAGADDPADPGISAEGEGEPVPPSDELVATEPGPGRKLARPKPEPSVQEAAEAAAGRAAGELAVETLAGKKPAEAALTVVKRRLPSLPTKEDFRNGALGVTGVALGGWLAWGFIAPVFAFLWTVTKVALLGGVAYAGYKVYAALPGRKVAEDGREPVPGADPETEEESEAEDAEAGPRTRDRTR